MMNSFFQKTSMLFCLIILSTNSSYLYAENGVKDSLQKRVVTDKNEDEISLEHLARRAIAIGSKPSIFHWRESPLLVEIEYGQKIEFNNYDSAAYGVKFRIPLDNSNFVLGLKKITVSPTPASEGIARTPYTQPGRPTHYELQPGFDIALVEGIGNQYFSIIPPMQIVVRGQLCLNYLIYPNAHKGIGTGKLMKLLLDPKLQEKEKENLRKDIPAGMELDDSRFDILFGFGIDAFTKSGLFINFDALYGFPSNNKSKMEAIWDLSLGVGYAL